MCLTSLRLASLARGGGDLVDQPRLLVGDLAGRRTRPADAAAPTAAAAPPTMNVRRVVPVLARVIAHEVEPKSPPVTVASHAVTSGDGLAQRMLRAGEYGAVSSALPVRLAAVAEVGGRAGPER